MVEFIKFSYEFRQFCYSFVEFKTQNLYNALPNGRYFFKKRGMDPNPLRALVELHFADLEHVQRACLSYPMHDFESQTPSYLRFRNVIRKYEYFSTIT